MRRVPSSYYNFRGTLRKNNSLLYLLKNFLTVEDVWSDLENAVAHFNVSAIRESGVYIFRTDVIKATPDIATQKVVTPKNMLKVLSNSKDGKCPAGRIEKNLIVKDLVCGSVNYCLNIPDGIKMAFFISGGSCFLVVVGGDGVFLFRDNGGCCGFVSELHCDCQNLLVSRLCRVLATENERTFIYNYRIRKYSLLDGSNISNEQFWAGG